MRASQKAVANRSSGPFTVNRRLNSSDSNSMSRSVRASARRVNRFSSLIWSWGQSASTVVIRQSNR